MTETKTLSLIHLEGNAIAVGEECEIPIGEYYYSEGFGAVQNLTDGNVTRIPIIASKNRISPDIPLIREKGVDKVATKYANEVYPLRAGDSGSNKNWVINQQEILKVGFIAGYNAAGGYSEADINKAIDYGLGYEQMPPDKYVSRADFIASLKQKPTTITIQWNNNAPVVDNGYVIEIL